MRIARQRVSGGESGIKLGGTENGFCYICGKRLPIRGAGAHRRKRIVKEHVIPRSVIGKRTPGLSSQWLLTLEVHRECEELSKQHKDKAIKAIHSIHTTHPDEWKKEDIEALLPMYRSEKVCISGIDRPIFGNISPVISGVWTWIRGLHAALYGSYLPNDVRHRVLAPLPGYFEHSKTSRERQLEEEKKDTQAILRIVTAGARNNVWDGVIMTNGNVQYRCVWLLNKNGAKPYDKIVVCVWYLDFPGVMKMSSLLHQQVPWRGMYQYYSEIPKNAAVVTNDTIQSEVGNV